MLGSGEWKAREAREFTTVGCFGATVQSVYLSNHVARHILDTSRDFATMVNDATKLDIALQNFVGALVPPPYVTYVFLNRALSQLIVS